MHLSGEKKEPGKYFRFALWDGPERMFVARGAGGEAELLSMMRLEVVTHEARPCQCTGGTFLDPESCSR